MSHEPQPVTVPDSMSAMLLTGHGGIDQLVYRQDAANLSQAYTVHRNSTLEVSC